jgi:hypothetical protein
VAPVLTPDSFALCRRGRAINPVATRRLARSISKLSPNYRSHATSIYRDRTWAGAERGMTGLAPHWPPEGVVTTVTGVGVMASIGRAQGP